MKSIYKYIIIATAALVSGLSVSAQNLPAGTYEGKNGVAYRKSSSLKPGTNDTYVVNLETFVYGEVTIKNTSIPADIVLVLDVSGSMDWHLFGPGTARSRQSYSYNSITDNTSNPDNSTHYFYKHTDGNYYQVKRGRYYTNDGFLGARIIHYYLYFIADGIQYFLYGDSVTTTRPSTPSQYAINIFSGAAGDTIWTGVLYDGVQLETRLTTLKQAVNTFIDQIHHNDLFDDDNIRRVDEHNQPTALGNQISIVKFASEYYSNNSQGYNSDSAPLTPGNGFRNGANYTQVVQGFTTTAEDTNITTLKAAVNSLSASGATAGDYGLNLARLLLNSIKNDRPESSKTVVFFTDGSPTYGNSFETAVASNAIGNAYNIKSNYGATIYTVGVFDDLGDAEDNVHNYMNFVSSNYPDARNMSQGNNPVPAAQRVFYQNADGANLSSVFKSIAEASGGSGATEVTSESTVTVDVVASSFSLPEGISSNDITVTIAPCTGQTRAKETLSNGKERLYFTFGQEKTSTAYGLPAIVPEVDSDHNMVTTSGFDFSANWCGHDASNNTWHGYKQTISFEIKLNEAAVGGPNVVTNDRKSGIYVNGQPVAEFNRPVVKIPVSLWIKKKGLMGEDSAVFNVQYAHFEEGVDPTTLPSSAWKSFTKVIVNSNSPKDSDGYPIVKLVGLDPDYFYRIKEDAWAWTYNYQDDGIQYAFGEDQQNPFVFTNIPEPNVKSGEGSVQNVFNAGTASPTTE